MEEKKVMIVPGGGIYFFWMLGFLRHVLENFSTDNVIFLSASSGALASVLACCQVDPDRAALAACRTTDKHGASNRWLGIGGVWGVALEEWLDEVLPEDAADRVRGKVRVVVNTAFPHQTFLVSNFRTRQSLIGWLRAACHLPFFMDYKPFYEHKGHWCYDAGISKKKDYFCGLIDNDACDYYYVNYKDDPTHDYGMACRLVDHHVMMNLVRRGTFYARHLDSHGWFDGLERNNSYQLNTDTLST